MPYFIDWLLENVHLVEITAYSDDDAYTIFETMNDRGLSLSPTDMLKGYLLANIDEAEARLRQQPLARPHPRAQRGGKGGGAGLLQGVAAQPVRHQDPRAQERRQAGGLRPHRHRVPPLAARRQPRPSASRQSDDFYRFIDRDFDFYSRQYLSASSRQRTGLSRAWSTCSTTPSTASRCSTCCCWRRCGPTIEARRSLRKVRVVARYPRHPAHVAALELPQHRLLDDAVRHVRRDARHPRLAPDALADAPARRLGQGTRPSPATTGCACTSRTATPSTAFWRA